jgi:hypothetical protein
VQIFGFYDVLNTTHLLENFLRCLHSFTNYSLMCEADALLCQEVKVQTMHIISYISSIFAVSFDLRKPYDILIESKMGSVEEIPEKLDLRLISFSPKQLVMISFNVK